MRLFILLWVGFYTISFAQESPDLPDYLNHLLPIEKRVDNLISRMTIEEKVSQMIDVADAVPRLQIPEYNWWNEGLHGVARSGIATVFPQAIGLAATWNTDLIFAIADAISTEARAKHHDYLRRGQTRRYQGLTYWSPNINIFRDPRWGRGQETYGEDPFLTSRIAVAFIKGLQGDDPTYLKLIATPKHYAVHSGPEPDRHTFDAVINNRDLWETYLPAFEASIKEGGAYSVMCAYNRYMGEACCSSNELLQTILRKDWGFTGYVVSDCGAIADIYERHKLAGTAADAAAMAVKSGTDLNCGQVYDRALLEAVEEGLIKEEEIDISLRRLFTARFKLGMFDPVEKVPYSKIPIEANDSKEHRILSVIAAQESIVLLKNHSKLLPLGKDLKRIAVIGPTADSYPMLLGNYNGIPSSYTTPLQGIKNKVGETAEVVFAEGCNLVQEGAITKILSKDILSTNDGKPGLHAVYFKNDSLYGDPIFESVDQINESNWIWGTRIPGLQWGDKFSIRWTGKIEAPATGDINFILKGDDGFRLYIDNQLLIEDWNKNDLSEKSNHISMEKGESYDFTLEYFYDSGWPQLSVHWELLDKDYFEEAVKLAGSSDVIVFVGGITAELEGEEMRVNYEGFRGGDRTSISLPKVQEQLLRALYDTGKPIVLVITSGSAISSIWAKENIPAILQIWYPGQEGGTALADVLFGDYNPAGRLPVTFYKSVDQLPPFEDYDMKGRTYKYFEGQPLYPFGYGLSYTTFKYENLLLPEEVKNGEDITVSVEVKNSGALTGDEVVQLYVKDVEASVSVPKLSLKGFKRITLAPGEKQKVEFVINPKHLALVNNYSEYVVEPGIFEISVGGMQPDKSVLDTTVLSGNIMITGETFTID